MARQQLIAVFACTVLGVAVNAGPYRPYPHSPVAPCTTTTFEAIATAYPPASSITTADTTDTTDTTDAVETTVTEPASETSSTVDGTLPSTASTDGPVGPPGCVETQILVNPSFDDNDDGSPWSLSPGVTLSQINPRSSPNFLYNTFDRGGVTTTTVTQTLPALGPFTYQLQYYINLQTAINGRSFSCSAVPSIDGQILTASQTLTENGPYGFRLSSQTFTAEDQTLPAALSIALSCQGDFDTVIIGADDFSLTRLCGN